MQKAGFLLSPLLLIFFITTSTAVESLLSQHPDTSRVNISQPLLNNGCNLDSVRATLTRAGNIELKGMDNTCSLYFVNPKYMSGSDAQAYAQTFGANLVSIQSEAENIALGKALDSAHFGGEVIWIGLSDEREEGNFEWYDGSEVVYTNWKTGEPNNWQDEDCVQIFTDGSWNDLNCFDRNSLSVIEVNICPITTIKPKTTVICEGDTVQLITKTILGAPKYTYSWVSDSTGFVSTQESPKVSPDTTTTYSVTVTDRYGCMSTGTVKVVVNGLTPKITTSGSTKFCSGDSVVLTSPNATSYEWSTGETTQSITVTTSGNYSLKIKEGVCVGHAQQTVIVYPSPVAAFKNTIECVGNPTVFTDQSTDGLVWSWDFGDGTPLVTAQNPKHTYTKSGIYNVTLYVDGTGNCKDSIQQKVVVHNVPAVSFASTNLCLKDSILFVDKSVIDSAVNIVSYSYDFGDGQTSVLKNPSHLYDKAGNYSVKLSLKTSDGCIATASNTVTVQDVPVAKFSVADVCEGKKSLFNDESVVNAPSVIKTRMWDFGDASAIDTTKSPEHLYASTKKYSVKLKVISDSGCADSTIGYVAVKPNPVVNFTATDTAGCTPFIANFQNLTTISSGIINKWMWEFGNINLKSDSKTPASVILKNTSNTIATKYSIKLTATSDSGCTATLSKVGYITVYPKPRAAFNLNPKETFVTNPIVSVTNLSVGIDSCMWSFGNTGVSDLINPVPYSFVDTGTYAINLIVANSYGCKDTTSHDVIILPDYVLYIPSAFTPNGDEVNDTFGAKGSYIKDYEMTIFDRWGNLVYETKDFNQPWNGSIKGTNKIAEEAVYVYVIKVKAATKRSYIYRGIVSVIR